MGLIDSLLNVAGLLLWLSWRSIHFVTPEKSSPLSLASALKRADPRRASRWIYLSGLLVLLGLRALFYWQIGSAVNWTPVLKLGAISVAFRSDYLWRMVLFSLLSFGLVLGVFYSWLLLISVINRDVPNDEPFQKLVRLHLGWVERWPAVIKALLPLLVVVLLWGLLARSVAQLGIVPAPVSARHGWQQAAVLGLASFLAWKFLLMGLLLLHLLNSYVYVGNLPFWVFVNTTCGNLLRPLRRLPWRAGKVDLLPVFALAVVVALAELGSLWLPRLYQRLPF